MKFKGSNFADFDDLDQDIRLAYVMVKSKCPDMDYTEMVSIAYEALESVKKVFDPNKGKLSSILHFHILTVLKDRMRHGGSITKPTTLRKPFSECEYVDDIEYEPPCYEAYYTEDFHKAMKIINEKLIVKDAVVIIMKEYMGFTADDLAKIVDCSKARIYQRINRGLDVVRRSW